MKGLREEGKHWEDYIKKTGRKEKATKAIGGAASVASLATGVGGVAKVGAKAAGKKVTSLAAKRMNRAAQKSKAAKKKVNLSKSTTPKGAKKKGLPVSKRKKK